MLEAVGPEDGGPDEFWGFLHYPKTGLRMMYEGHRPAAGGGEVPVLAQKIDRVVVVDPPAAAQGEVQIKQGGWRGGLQQAASAGTGLVPCLLRHFARRPARRPVLTPDFHLQDRVGLWPRADAGVRQQRDQPLLEGSETAFDLSLGLRSGGHQVRDPQRGQGTLKFAAGIAGVVGGTGTEEAQPIGVNRGGQPVLLEGSAEMAEVIPSGVCPDKASGHDESRMIIDAQEQGLFGGVRPPLMDAAVVLPQLPRVRTAEATIGPHPAGRTRHQPGKVLFHIGLDAGPGTVKPAQPLQFIRHELIVRRVLQRQETLQKAMHLLWPHAVVVAATGPWMIAGFVAQPRGAQLIETAAADLKTQRGAAGVKFAVIEGGQDAADIGLGESGADLFFFMSRIVTSLPAAPTHNLAPLSRGSAPAPPEFCALGQEAGASLPQWAAAPPRIAAAQPEPSAPMATQAAPVALQQSRILPVLPHHHRIGKNLHPFPSP